MGQRVQSYQVEFGGKVFASVGVSNLDGEWFERPRERKLPVIKEQLLAYVNIFHSEHADSLNGVAEECSSLKVEEWLRLMVDESYLVAHEGTIYRLA